jgi:hypothetical protein
VTLNHGSRVYACARCGYVSPASLMIFSRFTRRRYCKSISACDIRTAKLRARLQRTAAA